MLSAGSASGSAGAPAGGHDRPCERDEAVREEERAEHHRPRGEEDDHPEGGGELLPRAGPELDDGSAIGSLGSRERFSARLRGATLAASGSSSVWLSQSRPSFFVRLGVRVLVRPAHDRGDRRRSCGAAGGDGISHSSVPTCHGFFSRLLAGEDALEEVDDEEELADAEREGRDSSSAGSASWRCSRYVYWYGS